LGVDEIQWPLKFRDGMTRERIRVAVQKGIPFVIRMADGEKYEVTNSYQIALGKTFVVVVDKHDLPHVLPLRTMTGISYLKPAK
jgi:hypothetical protein